jgi:hypothetical protein
LKMRAFLISSGKEQTLKFKKVTSKKLSKQITK